MEKLTREKIIILQILLLVMVLAVIVMIGIKHIKKKQFKNKKARQLNYIKSRTTYDETAKATEYSGSYGEDSDSLKNIDIVKNISKILDSKLYHIGIRSNTALLAVIWILCALAVPVLIYILTKNIVTTVVVLLIILIAPFLVLNIIEKNRIEAFENQLADAINVMEGAISSGRSFQDSLAVVAKSSEEPIKTEFNILFNEVSLGTHMSDALENLSKRVKSPDVAIFCTALIVQSSIGGNLVLILDNIAETIRTRNRLKKEIKAKTASGRLSGVIVAMLPFVIYGFIRITNPTYITDFTSTTVGKVAFGFGILMIFIGILIIKKITDVKY